MRLQLLTAGLVVLATSTWAAAPPVGPLNAFASGSDLILSWEPPATAVDGYRVFFSDDVSCTSNVPIYTGPLTTLTVVDALADSAAGLYRVTSFVGTEESDPSPPAYEYRSALRSSTRPGAGMNLLSVFPLPQRLLAQELCEEVNGSNPSEPVEAIWRYEPDAGTFRNDNCGSPLETIQLVPGVADFAGVPSRIPTADVCLWGTTVDPLQINFAAPFAYDPNFHNGYGYYEYPVALPYDHDYTDLEAVAADLPQAVQIRLFDMDYFCLSAPCPKGGFGLGRATPADPWTGTSYSLEDRRGEGLMIGVAQEVVWTPRRRCTGPTSLGGGVQSLLAVANGDDIELSWDVNQSAGARRYDIYRVDNVAALANLDAQPVYRTESAAPIFPIVDSGAALLPGPLYYAVKVY